MAILDFLKSPIASAGETIFSGVSKIISNFKADPTEVAKAQAELEKIKLAHEETMAKIQAEAEIQITERIKAEEEAVTARWQADMGSDNKLSKYARPATLLSLLAFLYFIIVVDSLGYQEIKFDVKPEYIDLLKWLLITVVGAYFGGRTYEKLKRK